MEIGPDLKMFDFYDQTDKNDLNEESEYPSQVTMLFLYQQNITHQNQNTLDSAFGQFHIISIH